MNLKELPGLESLETRDYAPHTVRTGWIENRGTHAVRMSIVVHFGLHHICGNDKPYFSITVGEGFENGRQCFGGCCHDIIAARFPELKDMIALHLSDIDGAPMHAAENGYHWLSGVVELGERYAPARSSATDCLRNLADHLRITEQEALRIVGDVHRKYDAFGTAAAKAHFKQLVDCMRPRWYREALAAIEKYQLGAYGDKSMTPAGLKAQIAAQLKASVTEVV